MEQHQMTEADRKEIKQLTSEITERIQKLHDIQCKVIGVKPDKLEQFEFVVGNHGADDGKLHPDGDNEYGTSICNKRTHKGVLTADPPGICRSITC